MMESSSTAASTLRPPRFAIAIISAVATATIAYSFYRDVYGPIFGSSEFDRDNGLHRSNAVRRPRGPLRRQRTRRNSHASSSSESHADENAQGDSALQPPADGETVAEDATAMEDDWWNDPASQPQQQRAGQNIVNLLFRVSEDNARRNAYVHRGCACNGCGLIPIRGIRYRCANCADFDLCETCESQGLHIKTHIFYKVRIPAPPFGPRQSQPVWYPGDPENCLRNLPKDKMARLSKETGFERPELEAFWEQWTFLANTEWRDDPLGMGVAMDRKTFEKCLVPSGGYRHTAPNLIHDRMFAFYDTNNDDLIGFTEFLHGLAYRKRKDKLKRIFDGYDVDGDGLVSRKDFLRIFRAYYLLYKQMHQDIVEGLDDQALSSHDVQQLVTSRQPLSGFFGREGRVPPARDGRALEGKVRTNGEVFVDSSVKRVVTDDKPDHAERNAILTSLFDNHQARNYFRGLFSLPTRIDELPALLSGETNEDDDNMFVDQDASERHATGHFFGAVPSTEPSSPNVENDAGDASEHRDAAARQASQSEPPSEPLAELRRTRHRLAERSRMVAQSKRSQAEARKKLFERWQRRQFYLDEEEGAVVPDDWDEDEDFLAHTNANGESSNTAAHHGHPHMLSPRSRSNSKVRFAEDTDDYEIRSNPSTSSRSVPERWGGMEIPDAERDAGKEILYQVTQQSFNELLDSVFKAKEDMAIAAAETRELRAQYRSLFEDINLDEVDRAARAAGEEPGEDEVDTYRRKTLDELLASSGYTVEVQIDAGVSEEEGEEEGGDEDDGDANAAVLREVSLRAGELSLVGRQRQEQERRPVETAESQATEDQPTGEDENQDRDPTMPQFRPNSASAPIPPISTTSADQAAPPSPRDENTPPPPQTSEEKVKHPSSHKQSPSKRKPPRPLTRDFLVRMKRLDVAEAEARARGGWGRVTYVEFETVYNNSTYLDNRLDYLGSWIDFCIP